MQDATDIQPLVYTTAGVAKVFDVTPRTIQRWVKEKKLPPPIMPGRWARTTIHALLDDNSDTERHSATSNLLSPEKH